MTCQRMRELLLAGRDRSEELAAHFRSCPECARFAARWELARGTLGRDAADVPPPFAFARRVVAHLPVVAGVEEVLGRFAFRALPAAVLLALALAWAGLDQAPLPAASLLAEEPSAEELLTYSVLAPKPVPVAPVSTVRNVEAPR
jgi:hypothetical protein